MDMQTLSGEASLHASIVLSSWHAFWMTAINLVDLVNSR